MKLIHALFLLPLTLLVCSFISRDDGGSDWGFFGHKRINKLAVFILPEDCIAFFKTNISYLEEHSVDPDRRRHAVKNEHIKHYIDLDVWEKQLPIDTLPKEWTTAIAQYASVDFISHTGDTLETIYGASLSKREFNQFYDLIRQTLIVDYYKSDDFTYDTLYGYELPNTIIETDFKEIVVHDNFSQDGILPYNIEQLYGLLVKAMERRDAKKILRYCADIGHYLGDAHVPLHTTKNYNGQLTNQVGIHAFWETRLPELYADKEFNFFVGQAVYISDIRSKIWEIVTSSHQYVDKVLAVERALKMEYPMDQQTCYEERKGKTVSTQCRDYSAEYHRRLEGMVEERMRQAVHSVGSFWYSAWVDAGKPDLRSVKMDLTDQNQNRDTISGEVLGGSRGHIR